MGSTHFMSVTDLTVAFFLAILVNNIVMYLFCYVLIYGLLLKVKG